MTDGATTPDPRFALAAKYAKSGLLTEAWELLRDLTLADGIPAVPFWLLRGAVLQALRRWSDAAEAYQQAVVLDPAMPDVWNDLGLTHEALGDVQAAETAFARALAVDPAFAAAAANLGALYTETGQFAAAAETCAKALAAAPQHVPARINRAAALIEQGRHEEAAETLAPVASAPEAADTALYLLHYCSNDPPGVLRAHAGWGTRAPQPDLPPPVARDRDRLRVGYLSPDFRRHSVAYFLEPLLSAHNRDRLEIFCYPTTGSADDVTARLRTSADHWHDIAALDDAAACALIRGHELDVLVDLAGHTKGNRLGVFARRAAPVQVTALGYPGTTGLTQIDYRFGDAITDPAGAEAFSTERLLRLPRLHCYRPDDKAPAVAPAPSAATGHVMFGSFNKLGKVSDATVALWSAVLKAVPTSQLFLKSKALAEEATRHLTSARFAAAGIDPCRLTLYGWVPEDHGHLAAYGRVDIALDTFPYSGTTTTCEALWMGVPVLTLAGATHASRVSASLLTTVGLTDWIADSPEAFVARAVSAAADVEGLAALRAGLRQQMALSPLCDGAGYAAAVEAAYRAIATNEPPAAGPAPR